MPGRLYCQTSPTHPEMYNVYINTGIIHGRTALNFILMLSNTMDTGFETASLVLPFQSSITRSIVGAPRSTSHLDLQFLDMALRRVAEGNSPKCLL